MKNNYFLDMDTYYQEFNYDLSTFVVERDKDKSIEELKKIYDGKIESMRSK